MNETTKIRCVITDIILVGILLLHLTGCGNNSADKIDKSKTDNKTVNTTVDKTEENAFVELRKIALTVSPEQLGLSLPKDKTIVFGVIMDWEIEGGTASTVAYQTGDASLYLSSGGGIIGGGQNQNVNNAAKRFVESAQAFLGKATRAKNTQLPLTKNVTFYLLTNHGIYVGQEQIQNFQNNSSSWLQLFKEGNTVLDELRKTIEIQD
jgi:hypothetical protein